MNKLGNTHMLINKLGMGGIPIQRIDSAECKAVIKQAKNSGINFIDTAVGYTVSEEYIGEALKEDPHSFFVATKSMARTYDSMKTDILSSLTRLQRQYIDLYQIHWPFPNMPLKEAMDTLMELKEKKLITKN